MAKKDETLPAVKEEAGLPAVIDYAADAGVGFEDTDSSDYAVPFLRQLQSMSGQCKKMDPDFMQGAEEGDFLNTVTNKLYKGDVGVTLVPCHYVHKYNRWAPDRGGFRGSLTPEEYAACAKTTAVDSKGNEHEAEAETGFYLSDTREHYVLVVEPDGNFTPALLSLSGTQLKKSKKWMSLMRGIRIQGSVAPMFSQTYHVTAVGESNDKGSWAGVKIEHVGIVTDPELYAAAKEFNSMVRSGTVKAAPVDGLDADDLPY